MLLPDYKKLTCSNLTIFMSITSYLQVALIKPRNQGIKREHLIISIVLCCFSAAMLASLLLMLFFY